MITIKKLIALATYVGILGLPTHTRYALCAT